MYGPYDLLTLRRSVADGRTRPSDPVKLGELGAWVLLQSLPADLRLLERIPSPPLPPPPLAEDPALADSEPVSFPILRWLGWVVLLLLLGFLGLVLFPVLVHLSYSR